MQMSVYMHRTTRNLTQTELSRLAKIHQTELSRLERHERPLFPGWRARLAAAFGCSPDDIVG